MRIADEGPFSAHSFLRGLMDIGLLQRLAQSGLYAAVQKTAVFWTDAAPFLRLVDAGHPETGRSGNPQRSRLSIQRTISANLN